MKTQNNGVYLSPAEILEAKYVESHMACVGLLSELVDAVEDMPADRPSWPRVATLNLVAKMLADALAAMPADCKPTDCK